MCGRFALVDWSALSETFGVGAPPGHPRGPRFNIPPGVDIPVVIAGTGVEPRRLVFKRWSFPAVVNGRRRGYINIRSETVAVNPLFRKAFHSRRCLVPAEAFYEWRRTGSGRFPYLFRLKSTRLFAMAAVWQDDGCAILTTAANDIVGRYHHRMPVIIRRRHFDDWLGTRRCDLETLLDLAKPIPGDEMECHQVSILVNSPSCDGPACFEKVEGNTLFD